MGRNAVPAAFKRSRQFCAMFTPGEAARIEKAIELGFYATPSDLMRDAIERRLKEVESETAP